MGFLPAYEGIYLGQVLFRSFLVKKVLYGRCFSLVLGPEYHTSITTYMMIVNVFSDLKHFNNDPIKCMISKL